MKKDKKKVVFFTGSGISAESGIPTFRGAGGLWNDYSIEDVCTAEGFLRDPELVHNFYNEMRQKVAAIQPNEAHKLIASLEKDYDVSVITQNVDNLHEKAGSTNVLHLHGEIMKVRAIDDDDVVIELTADNCKTTPDGFIQGHKVRPHIVFFEEYVPNMPEAFRIVREADIFIIVGTSLTVYPAASLPNHTFAPDIFYVDPEAARTPEMPLDVHIIRKTASEGLKEVINSECFKQ